MDKVRSVNVWVSDDDGKKVIAAIVTVNYASILINAELVDLSLCKAGDLIAHELSEDLSIHGEDA